MTLRRILSRVLLPVALLSGAIAAPLLAEDAEVPYWTSLSKDKTNLRVGPGRDYRISWVYVRKGLPMKVLRTMGGWRLVEEPDGTRGWVLARFLTRTRTGIVKGGVSEVRENADGTGRLMWKVEPGVVGRLGNCDDGWCQFDIDGRVGYIRQLAVWGAGNP